jgi:hypothetical protein
MCFEVCGINRDSLIVRGLFGQSHHDPSEHDHITPVDRQHIHSMCERGRFHRLHSVFGGPHSTGAPYQRRRGSACSCLDTSTGRLIGPTARNVMYPIAIDEYNATQYTKVIHASTTSALWKLRPQPLHLRLSQPIQIARDILQQLGIMNHGNATSSTN